MAAHYSNLAGDESCLGERVRPATVPKCAAGEPVASGPTGPAESDNERSHVHVKRIENAARVGFRWLVLEFAPLKRCKPLCSASRRTDELLRTILVPELRTG